MATTPSYIATPTIDMTQISAANTNRDGTGTTYTVAAGVSGGKRILRVIIKAIVTTTAGMVRLYLYDGTNTRLIFEQVIPAITVAASVAGSEYSIPFADLILPSTSWELKASTHNAETFNVVAFGGSF